MVGYITGLGDRHTQNILVDVETAELIHIDFGVTFESGMLLKTPERVPFRLTRDIVAGQSPAAALVLPRTQSVVTRWWPFAGLGVSQVEGTFRIGCQEVMRVLRSNSQSIMTVLEVFRHDPLCVSSRVAIRCARPGY